MARCYGPILFSAALLLTVSCDTNVDARATSMYSPSTEDLNGIWGFGQSDVWAVGIQGTIFHFDGTSWKKVFKSTNPSCLGDVWAASATRAFAVGDDGVIMDIQL